MKLFENLTIEIETLATGYVATARVGTLVVTDYAHFDKQATIDGLFARISNIAINNDHEGACVRSCVDE